MKILVIGPRIPKQIHQIFPNWKPQAELHTIKETQEGLDMILSDLWDIVLFFISDLSDLAQATKLVQEMRLFSYVPFIACGPKDENILVEMLRSGADRYISFPCSRRGFLLQIDMTVRFTTRCSQFLLSGPLVLNQTSHEVSLRGEVLELTPIEYQLLRFLMANPNRAFAHRDLLEAVWGENGMNLLTPESAKWHIWHLREKLRDPRWIETLHGFGYRFHGPPQ